MTEDKRVIPYKPKALRTLLANTAVCLRHSHKLVSSLEDDFFGNGMPSSVDPAQTARLQPIDLLSQTLDEISALLERLAIEIPADYCICHETVVTPVKLETLREIMGQEKEHSTVEPTARERKPIELF